MNYLNAITAYLRKHRDILDTKYGTENIDELIKIIKTYVDEREGSCFKRKNEGTEIVGLPLEGAALSLFLSIEIEKAKLDENA